MARGNLKPEDENCIQRNYVQLKENVEAMNIVDFLFQESVISADDKERILKGSTKSERMEHLLTAILHAGPGDAFEKFIISLQRKNYSHLSILQERGSSIESIGNREKQKESSKIHKEMMFEQQITVFDIAALFVGESVWGDAAIFKTFKKYKNMIFQPNGIARFDLDGRQIQLVNSPSIDMYMKNTQKLISKTKQSVETISEGFHAVLLGIKYHSKMDTQDFERYVNRLKSMYGSNIVQNYCILVIVLNGAPQEDKVNFNDWFSQQDDDFTRLFEECGRRAVFIDNKANEVGVWTEQMKILIREIDSVQFNGRRYTSRQFREAENGRKRMIIEEKKDDATTEVLSKCKSVLASSRTANDYSEENASKIKSLIEEVENIQREVSSIDEGTDVFIDAKTFVDSVHDLLTKKALDLMDRKTFSSQEKCLLEKTENFETAKRDEDDKIRLRNEIMQLKEHNSMLKTKVKKYEETLNKENHPNKQNEEPLKNKMIQTANFKENRVNSISVEKLSPGMSRITPKHENTTAGGNENDYSVHVHLRGKYFTISMLCEWLAILFLIIFPIVINYPVYQESKSSFWTGVDSENPFLNYLKNSTVEILAEMEKTAKVVDYMNTRHISDVEEIKRNLSHTILQNQELGEKLSMAMLELDNIKKSVKNVKKESEKLCYKFVKKYC